MAKLILKLKGTTIEEIPITKPSMTIGRVMTNDIVIDNLAVSRHHARIVQDDQGYLVEDLGSGNGLFVNEQQVATATLRNRDEILVGKHALVFVNEVNIPIATHDTHAAALAEATIILNPKRLSELAQGHGDQETMASEQPQLKGYVAILSGGAPQAHIELVKRTTVGGKSQTADIRLRGVCVGQSAFIISQKPDGFFITHAEGKRLTKVNGEIVAGQRVLQDGDLITVGATKMQFYRKRG